MDPIIVRGLNDKMYEKRKASALDLEKLVRQCHSQGDVNKINQIIDELIELFSNTSHALHARNGGLIGLAATGIALGVEIAPYMEKFINPLLVCFMDGESRIRYFAAESMYNIAKVSKGEILVYFNPIFDALSKLAADSELSVKNGAELLDRLLKDIVAEAAPFYVPQFPQTESARKRTEEAYGLGIMVNQVEESGLPEETGTKKAFSLAHFMPLLADRIYVLSPFTRSYLVSWITVIDSVPDLELVAYLPNFLDGLLKYLSDPTEEVRVATENLLADFLREIKDIAILRKKRQVKAKARREAELAEQERRAKNEKERLPDITMVQTEGGPFIPETTDDPPSSVIDHSGKEHDHVENEEAHDRDTGAWIPGQGVKVDQAAIVEILIQQLDGQHDEIQQSTALRWLLEFLGFAQEVMVPFTPRLIPAILPNLAHHVSAIQTAALKTNQNLFNVIQNLPSPSTALVNGALPSGGPLRSNPSSPPTQTPVSSRTGRDGISSEEDKFPVRSMTLLPPLEEPPSTAASSITDKEVNGQILSRPGSPSPSPSVAPPTTQVIQLSPIQSVSVAEENDPFDYQATVNVLTIQFLSEHEDTRVAALKWLIMLHQKAPKKILAMNDGTFPALLKTLSDSSEEVIKHDLQLLAQISSSSEEGYFKSFMINLLDLFSTDRRLLETRGSLIIRQLCLSLNTERIYRTLAEILEKEEDLEFASIMVQKLNIILITSPELLDFRKRLKSLETRQDGQALFTTLYRSWCHNAVAVFALCLLAQAYEHASNLLTIFADLEITVQLLVQVDKLVQLIESPVFTYLRLQLLEPEKYPHLFKCLYGLLMLLPQSSAFVSLRNRLNAVSSMGFLHIGPRANSVAALSSRSKISRDEIKWQELLSHFRSVQLKHEKARRIGMGGDPGPLLGGYATSERQSNGQNRPQVRRKTTGESGITITTAGRASPLPVLSPLNPKARSSGGLLSTALSGNGPPSIRPLSPTLAQAQRQRRGLSLNRK